MVEEGGGAGEGRGEGALHLGELESVLVVGVAGLTMELRVAHTHVGAGGAVAEAGIADEATEAIEVVEETEGLDDHRRSSTPAATREAFG